MLPAEQAFVADITYIKLENDWAYLALVTDLYSKKIMGYKLADNMKCPLLSLSLKFQSATECLKIKNGGFYYYSKSVGDTVEIERTDSLHLERVKRTGHILKNKAIWQTDCSYLMYINALSDSKLNEMDSTIATIPITVNIINVAKQYYVYYASFKIVNAESKLRIRFILVRIKNDLKLSKFIS